MSKYRNKIVKRITLEILQEYSKKILAGILSREQVVQDSDKLLELYNKNELDYPTSEKYFILIIQKRAKLPIDFSIKTND